MNPPISFFLYLGMTYKVYRFLQDLHKFSPTSFYSISENPAIQKAVIDYSRLNLQDVIYMQQLLDEFESVSDVSFLYEDRIHPWSVFRDISPFKKGEPDRINGSNYKNIFIDECKDMDLMKNFYNREGASDHISDALKYSWAENFYVYGTDFGNSASHDDISEERLREKLKEEEAKENYEMCAEILKYAESKGINL